MEQNMALRRRMLVLALGVLFVCRAL